MPFSGSRQGDVNEKPSWFKNRNSCGLAGDLWLALPVPWRPATGGAGKQTRRPRGFLLEKLGLPLQNLGLGLGQDHMTRNKSLKPPVPQFPFCEVGPTVLVCRRSYYHVLSKSTHFMYLCV